MKPIRLESKILLYFLAMVVVVLAFVFLNQNSQRQSLAEINNLSELYQRTSLVHELNAHMISLQYYVSEYYEFQDNQSFADLEVIQEHIASELSQLGELPRSSSEAALINELDEELERFFTTFQADMIPKINILQQAELDFSLRFDQLTSGLEAIGSAVPEARQSINELGPLFIAVSALRRDTVVFFANPDLELAGKLPIFTQNLESLTGQLKPYYPGLDDWNLEAKELVALLSQAIEEMGDYLDIANVYLANSVSQMILRSQEIGLIYDREAAQAQEDIEQQLKGLQYQYITLSGIAVLLALLLSWSISHQIGNPIHTLIEVFEKLASGKRIANVPMLDRQDDFGKLARAAEIFRHKNEDTQYLLHQSQSLVRELQDLNAELSEQIAVRERVEISLAHRQSDLERSNRDLSQFAYAASHDLQEPLRMVSSYLQLLERRYKDQLDNDARDFIGFAVDGASRMKNLIRSLLDYSRIGTHGNDFKEVDLNVVAKAVMKNLELLIREHQAEVTYSDLPIVWGDEAQLLTLIQNIVTNSIHYHSDKQPEVRISSTTHSDHYELSISDNGIGFEQQYSEKIFTIFQRLHGRNVYADGTGIGLALSKRIVERHKGKIWANSAPGEGTTIHFCLPIKGTAE